MKGYRRGRKLVACFNAEHQVVIHDLETGDQKEVEINDPMSCAASQHTIAVTTFIRGLHLFSTDGTLAHIVLASTDADCVAFHPHNHNILAIGDEDGSVRIWDVSTQTYLSEYKEHTDRITNIRFAPDFRLLLSSHDFSSSIVELDDQLNILSSVKLKGHIGAIFDILLFFLFEPVRDMQP